MTEVVIVKRNLGGDPYIEWVHKDWRFSLHGGDEPCWIFVNREDTQSGDLTIDVWSFIVDLFGEIYK